MDERYEDKKIKSAEREARISAAGREIGPIPQVKDPKRRAKAEQSLKYFLEEYFAEAFKFAWSPDHLQVIELIESAVHNGNTQAIAMPRGSGKTTICTRAVVWAIVCGYHNYVMLIAADDTKASKMLTAIKSILMNNIKLKDDFPEALFPIHKLKRQTRLTTGQTCQGEPTGMDFTKSQIVMPTIPDSPSSGAVIETGGIESAVRGGQYTRSTGEVVRPTLALVDDPQTRRSAASVKMSYEREMIIAADLLGMAGPGETLSILMTCTVIYPNDVADRMLNRKEYPEWHGIRCQMLYEMPKKMELWDQYWEIRRGEMLVDHPKGTKIATIHKASNAFYRKHQKAMNEGASVSWDERKLPGEHSAIQHAMNLYLKNPEAFDSEYQNTPQSKEAEPEEKYATSIEISQKINGYERYVVPAATQKLVGFIDVQQRLLYYVVMALGDDMTGWILDYGTHPKQSRKRFVAQKVQQSLERMYGGSLEHYIRAGLDDLTTRLIETQWKQDDQTSQRIERLAIDANWGKSTNTIKDFCRGSDYGAILLPSHGRGIEENHSPISSWSKKIGEQRGLELKITRGQGREVRHLIYDTNFWKSLFMRRISTPIGTPGSISLYGTNKERHDFLAEQLTAEKPTMKEGRRRVEVWSNVDSKENHWFDCAVGCCATVNTLGINPPGIITQSKPVKKRVSLSQLKKGA